MSVEEQTFAKQTDTYAGLLDNFGSEIGSTLEDLAVDWNESEYDFADDIGNGRSTSIPVSSRGSSFQSRVSMDTNDELSDWSLRKARPLAFANPVYDLLSNGRVVTKPRQMNLIPLSQFEINKHHDDSGKHSKHKQQKGLMKKLSNFTIRKHHSLKKQEPEMEVTAPLWTDAPAAYGEVTRSVSFTSKSSTLVEETENHEEQQEEEKNEQKDCPRPHSLKLEDEGLNDVSKVPPQKTPRTSKAYVTPVCEAPDEIPSQPDEVFQSDTQVQYDTDQTTPTLSLVPPEDQAVRSAGSSTSITSDLSEDALEEERTTKTMMEVMHEIEDDSASGEESLTHDKENKEENEEEENENEDAPLLKRNKTLKWSGSRAAPALIREFTRKSKKMKQIENVSTDSPEVSAGESPAKSEQRDALLPMLSPTEIDDQTKKTPKSASDGRSPAAKKRDSSAFTILSSLLPPAPKLRRSESTKIRTYIHRMGTNSQNALGYATTEFVKLTLHSSENRPVVLLHSIRSFLTDIKKYLITNPHVGFMAKIQKIIKHMPLNDVEGAIDDALERLVLYPLRDYIYKRLVLDYARTGKIKMVEDAIKVGRMKSAQELGVRATLIPPNDEAMETVKQHFMELQTTYSPYYKLKHLLSAVTTIYENTSDLTCDDQSARKIGADDFLPLLVLAIVKCDFAAADIEAQYIDGLLDPALLLGEGGYYLTTLISAVQVLSSMKKREAPLPNITDLQGFLKVGISPKTEKILESESKDSYLMHKTLHVPPSMTAHNLGLMIAKKYGIKNTKSFCLHVVVNGVAYPLKPQEFPQLVKMDLLTQFPPGSFYFVYRQINKNLKREDKRPGTVDSEYLKVNTENGEEAVISADKDSGQLQSPESSNEGTSEDSDGSLKRNLNVKSLSLEDLPPPDDSLREELSSPGFADIPLPETILLNQNAISSEETILPSDTSAVVDGTQTRPTDTSPCPDDFPLPPDTLAEGETTPEQAGTLRPSPPYSKDLPSPPDTIPSIDIPLPDIMPPPPVEEDLSNVRDSSSDSSESETGSGDEAVVDETYLRAAAVDDELSPIKKKKTPRSTKVNERPKSLMTLEEEMSPIENEEEDIYSFADNPQGYRKDDHVPTQSEVPPDSYNTFQAEESLEVTVESSQLEDIAQKAPEQEKHASTEGTSDSQRHTPQVTLTDYSEADLDQRPESALSENSSGSIGCHSDGYHGSGGDDRPSSRGYHSDGHVGDDHTAMDSASHSSVSALKSYFEEEIHKVSQQASRSISPHSPK